MLLNTFVSTNSTPTDKMPLIDYKWSAIMPGTRKLLDYGKSHSNAQLFYGRGISFDGVDQNIPITINADVKTICYSKAGGVVYDETAQTLTDFTINSELLEDTRNNYIFYDGLFTDTQKSYLENYPEKFLYREDSILKSKILSQSEIDNVVAYLPLCETDGYVRDLVGYSEDSNAIEGITPTLDAGWVDNEDGTYTCDGTNGFIRFGAPLVSGSEYYSMSTEIITITSGKIVPLYDGNNGIYHNSVEKIDEVIATTTANLYIYSLGFVGTVRPIYAKRQIDGTYPIANYTDACRDDAKQLSTGLQTCFWKRDLLGVPYAGSFDRLNCDGVGYADTGWIPDVTKPLSTEIILEPATSTEYKIGCSDHATARYIFGYSSLGTVGVYLGNRYPGWGGYSGAVHIVLATTGVVGESEVFINGVSKGSLNETEMDAPISTFHIGRRGTTSNSATTTPTRLFKVHNKTMTPQDSLALYESAVKKGLLL